MRLGKELEELEELKKELEELEELEELKKELEELEELEKLKKELEDNLRQSAVKIILCPLW